MDSTIPILIPISMIISMILIFVMTAEFVTI